MSAVTEIRWAPQSPERELRPLFENAPIALAQCLRQGAITALNSALESLLADRPETTTKSKSKSKSDRSLVLADLMHPEHLATAERLLAELFDGTRDHFQIDSAPAATNGRPVRWTAWRASATKGGSDFVLATVEVIAESALQNAESEHRLRQAQKLEVVGRLAGGIAHDFNNLLTGVLLYCDLLMASLEPDDRVHRYAEEIRNASVQASGLVRQLLNLARPTYSEPRPLSLNEIAEGMRNLLQRLIGENIQLKFRLDPNLGLTRMDPTQAQQILMNLVLNARDAMPGGGEIAVETGNCTIQILTDRGFDSGPASLPCALLAVVDNGHGMDAGTRARIFETFFTTKARKGTGLGMSTVHDIVTSNGGLIHVDSAPAQGCRITVLLPLAPDTAPDSAPSRQEIEPVRNEGEIPATVKKEKPNEKE